MKNYLSSLAFIILVFVTKQNVNAQCIPNFFMFSNRVECLGDSGVKIHWTQEQWVSHDVYRRIPGDTVWGGTTYT